jgi:hypothetical protein
MEAGMQVRYLEDDRGQEDQCPNGQNAARKGPNQAVERFQIKGWQAIRGTIETGRRQSAA